MEIVAQLVRASDCGSEGRGFDPHLSPVRTPFLLKAPEIGRFFNAVSFNIMYLSLMVIYNC